MFRPYRVILRLIADKTLKKRYIIAFAKVRFHFLQLRFILSFLLICTYQLITRKYNEMSTLKGLHFVQCCQILLGPHYETYFISYFWFLEVWGGV
jgi:hypothetical protein